MASSSEQEFGLYMGNLRRDCRIRDLKRNIVNLMNEIGLVVSKRNVHIVSKPHTQYAFVYFNSASELKSAVDILTNSLDKMDTNSIVSATGRLKVGPKHPKNSDQPPANQAQGHSMKNGSISPEEKLDSFEHLNTSNGPIFSQINTKVQPNLSLHSDLVTRGNPISGTANGYAHKTGAATNSRSDSPGMGHTPSLHGASTSGHLNNSNNQRPLPLHLSPQTPMSDTVLVYHGANAHGHVDPNKISTFKYIKGHKLGNETRNIEYKCGQGSYVKRQLVPHVSKYMCAYLNSEGGVLIIGVSDDGCVKGIHGIDRRTEDDLRTKIDTAIRGMSPKVFPSMYRVSFVQVMDSNLQPVGSVKVIEVEVESGTASQLYETDRGEVYIRRDGSVQGPLKASDIQEWTRIKITKELEKVNKEIHNLQEKQSIHSDHSSDHRKQEELNKLKQSKARLLHSKTRLEDENKDLQMKYQSLENERDFYKREAEKKRSAICTIS